MSALPRTRIRLALLAVSLCLAFNSSSSFAQEEVEEGLYITVPNPIKEESVEQIKQRIDRARGQQNRNIKKIIFDFNPAGKESSTRNYGVCYNLASYIRGLSLNQGLKTIGFIQAKTTGHTVLPALACSELVLTSDASMGQVAEGGAIPEKNETDYYLKLAGARAVFVQKMFDPNVQINSGLLNGNTVYFDARQIKEPPFVNAKNPQPVREFAPGRVELYSAKNARHYEICNKVLEVQAGTDRRDAIRREYGLDEKALIDQALGERACRIEISGNLDAINREKISRQLKESRGRNEDTIFFVLDCGGGDPQIAYEIAKEILGLTGKDDQPVNTIAWIPDRASDLGLFIALACHDILMYRGANPESDAVLGDFENFLKPKGNNPDLVKKLYRELLEVRAQTGRSPVDPLLIDLLLDRDAVVIRGRNVKTNETRLFKQGELEAEKDWQFDGQIKPKGKLLELRAKDARELRVVKDTLDKKEMKAVYALYSLENSQVRDAEPHWLDSFSALLRRKEVSIILILIGIGGLILEMKAPGLMVPGIMSALCFILFFWSQSQLNSQIIYLAILLFMLGVVLIAMEIFVLPGFGIPGISGILMIIAGLGLATVDKIPTTTDEWSTLAMRVLQYALTMIGSTVLALIFARYLSKIPYANRLMLVPPSDGTDGAEQVYLPGAELAASLLGKTGVALSMLRPSGTARFDDVIVDVVSEGDFVPVETRIQVIEVEGTRIVVKKL